MRNYNNAEYAFRQTKLPAICYYGSAALIALLPRSIFTNVISAESIGRIGYYWPTLASDFQALRTTDPGLAGKYIVWALVMPFAFVLFTAKYIFELVSDFRGRDPVPISPPGRQSWAITVLVAPGVLFAVLFKVPVDYKARSLSEFVLVNSASLWWMAQLFLFGFLWRAVSIGDRSRRQ